MKNKIYDVLNLCRAVKLKAFTLVELLVTLTIVAIISAIIIPNFIGGQQRAKQDNATARAAVLDLAKLAFLQSEGANARVKWHKANQLPDYPLGSDGNPGAISQREEAKFDLLRPYLNVSKNTYLGCGLEGEDGHEDINEDEDKGEFGDVTFTPSGFWYIMGDIDSPAQTRTYVFGNYHDHDRIFEDNDNVEAWHDRYIVAVKSSCGDCKVYGGGYYQKMEIATIYAKSGSSHKFKHWLDESGNIISTHKYTAFKVHHNTTLMAVCEEACPPPPPPCQKYTVTVLTDCTHSCTVSGGGTFTKGTNTTVAAHTCSQCDFINWTDEEGTVYTEQSFTFAVTRNITLTAHCRPKCPPCQYTVTVLTDCTHSCTVSGGGTFPKNTSVTVSTVVCDQCNFVNWTDDTGAVVSTATSYTFTVTRNITLTAHCTAKPPCQYTVTVLTDCPRGCTVSGGGTYAAGTSVTISTAVSSNCNFVNWTDDTGAVVSTATSYTFNVTRNITFTAHCCAKPPQCFTVTVLTDCPRGCTVSGGGTFPGGTSVTVSTAVCDQCNFVNWTDDTGAVVSTATSYTFTVTRNITLTAHCCAKPPQCFTVTVLTDCPRGCTVSGGGTFPGGTSVTVSTSVCGECDFVNWTDDTGAIVSTSTSYTFTVCRNITLTAHCKCKPPQLLTVKLRAMCCHLVSGGGTFTKGTVVTVTAKIITDGPRFLFWTDDTGAIVSMSPVYTFTLTRNIVLTANYDPHRDYFMVVPIPDDSVQVTGVGVFLAGKTVTVTATPNAWSTFQGWFDNGGRLVSSSPVFSFVLRADTVLIARAHNPCDTFTYCYDYKYTFCYDDCSAFYTADFTYSYAWTFSNGSSSCTPMAPFFNSHVYHFSWDCPPPVHDCPSDPCGCASVCHTCYNGPGG